MAIAHRISPLPHSYLPAFSHPLHAQLSRASPIAAGSPSVSQGTDIQTRFGQRLRTLRQARQLTQLEMSRKFGIDRSFISDVERGRKSISLHLLEVIAIGLRVSLSDLLRDL